MSLIGMALTVDSGKENKMATQKDFLTASKILDESIEVLHARGRKYADPATNHLRISHLWSTYLERYVSPQQVAGCMALLKIARSMESPDHLDNFVDGAAYLAIAGELGGMDWENYGNY
jgi:hypothetical protein